MAHERVTLYGVPLVADRLVNYGKDRPGAGPRAVHPARARLRRVAAHAAPVLREEPRGCSRRPRSSSTGPGGATSSSTSTRSSTSTTPASAPRSSAARTSTSGGSRSAASSPTCSPSTRRCSPTTRPRRSARPTTRETWQSGAGEGLTFPISYHFEPGAADDGLTIDVPVATLNRVDADDFSWNVPGLREELVTGLIRSLPKNLRVNFVPAPNRPRVPRARCRRARSRCSTRWSATSAPPPAWSCRARPGTGRRCPSTCARPTASSTTAAASRPAARTSRRSRSRCGRRSRRRSPRSPPTAGVARTGETDWVFGTIEASFTQKRAGHEVRGFPGLVDEGETVGLRVFGSEDEQEARHRLGVRRLLLLTSRRRSSGCSTVSTTPRSSAWPGRRTPPSPSCSRTAGPPWSATVVDARPPVRDEAAFAALAGRAAARPGGAPARGAGRRAARARRVAPGREGAQRPRRHDHAARAVRHEGAARAARAPRLRRRGRRDPAAPLPDVPRRARAPARAARRATSPATGS